MKPRTTKTLLVSFALAVMSVVALTAVSRAAAAPAPVLIPLPWPPLLVDYVSVVGTETLTADGVVVYSVLNGDSFILVNVGVADGEVFQRLGSVDTIKVHSPQMQVDREGPLGIIFEPDSDVVLKKRPGQPDVARDFSLIGYLAR